MARPDLIAFVLGTRPEAIKLAPILLRAREHGAGLKPVIISTGQQADLVIPALATFGLEADYELSLMRPGQSVGLMTARCLAALSRVLAKLSPRLVIVQGDTSSAVAGALAAFYEHIPVAHVEAGLRTRDLAAPFPEEANRQIISRVASLHFAPTLDAKANLLADGVDATSIPVTGNTVVDALELLRDRIDQTALPPELPATAQDRNLVLVTAHRRENQGRPLESICEAIRQLSANQSELHFAFITHPNPAAHRIAHDRLAENPGVTLLPPLTYLTTLRLVSTAWLILTDSGGLQEEAPSFGCPVLVLRDRTERTEGIACGAARLIGTDTRRIIREVRGLIESRDHYAGRIPQTNPYGDGFATKRILAAIRRFLEASRPKRMTISAAASSSHSG